MTPVTYAHNARGKTEMKNKLSEIIFDLSERLPKCLNAVAWALDRVSKLMVANSVDSIGL